MGVKFKIGDIITRTEFVSDGVTIGQNYEVLGFEKDSQIVRHLDDNGNLTRRNARYYRIYEQSPHDVAMPETEVTSKPITIKGWATWA